MDITQREFIKNQICLCEDQHVPLFMPLSGICYRCHRNITEILIRRGETGMKIITGCPLCFISYCE